MIYLGFSLILLFKLCAYGCWCALGMKFFGYRPILNWRISTQLGLLCLGLGILGTILFIVAIRSLEPSNELWLRGAMLAVPLASIRLLEWGGVLRLIIWRGQVRLPNIRPAKWRACLWVTGGILLEVTSDWVLLWASAAC